MRLPKDEAVWSLIDQGAVSVGNFLTALVLARCFTRSQYGTFSILFLALISINTLHQSLVIYPLTLAIAGSSDASSRESIGRSIAHTAVLWVLWLVLLTAILLVLHRIDVFGGMAAAMLAWQLQEVARRALLADGRARDAILPDVLSYLGQAAILLAWRPISVNQVFLCIAATSTAALAWQLCVYRPAFHNLFEGTYSREVWKLGKFSLVANSLNLVMLQFPSWLLRFLEGMATVGSYQALANIGGIVNPIIFSMSNMLIPSIARASRTSHQEARRVMLKYGLRFGVLLLPCLLLLAAFPERAMLIVYGRHSPYVSLAPLLRVLSFTVGLQYLATIVGAYEGGMSRPRSYMYAQIVSVAVLITMGSLLIRSYGIAGAVYAGFIVAVARLLTFVTISRSADLVFRAQPLPLRGN